MTVESLQKQYINVPEEMKVLKRWVCFRKEELEGEIKKMPINAINGKYAKSNDPSTWTRFNLAIGGCVKYKCDGIGFMLGDGVFGIDLDDGAYKRLKKGEITEELYKFERQKFDIIINEFVKGLNSYSERSVSGKGVHIICYGKLPEGRRRKGDFESYEKGRFFAMTGDVINNVPLQHREEEIIPLWKKYIDDGKPSVSQQAKEYVKPEFELDDELLIEKIQKSVQGAKFKALMEGDLTIANDDHSSADQMLCNILAFWTAKNKEQMDRIFRNSALYREKWERLDYREWTLNKAISITKEVYQAEIPSYLNEKPKVQDQKFLNEETGEITDTFLPNMNIDEEGEPIFKIKKIYKAYTLDDTGNAMRFYDYFGDLFRYNKTDKVYMYWTGKTWIRDEKDIIKKYANKLIEIMREEAESIKEKIERFRSEGKKDEENDQKKLLEAFTKNITRISNKAGKDAMLSELTSYGKIPVTSHEFNKDIYLLNTESGIVNLLDGKLYPFDHSKMISKNTNCKVSFQEPKNWIAFLESIFYRGDSEIEKQETNEILKFIQMSLGYSLSGSCAEQGLFLLFGGGSNGKSTFTEQIAYMMGDYADNVQSAVLMQQKVQNNAATYSLAKLKNTRFVSTGETDEGGKLAEAQIKSWTGDEKISARFLYGNEFSYKPEFKIWMSTNNKPIIRGTDFGIWRRIFPIPFIRTFTKEQKDRKMPEKLRAETAQILGWCIQGFKLYTESGGLDKNLPACLERERDNYKTQMDIVEQFLEKQCQRVNGYLTSARALYQNYKVWAQDNTEYLMKQSKFEEEILNKKITVVKKDGERHYKGIKMNSDKSASIGYDFTNQDYRG